MCWGKARDAHSHSWTQWFMWVHSNSKYSVILQTLLNWYFEFDLWFRFLHYGSLFSTLSVVFHHLPLHPLSLSLPLNCWECSSKLLFWLNLISPLKMRVWKRVGGIGAFFIILWTIFYSRVNSFMGLWRQKTSEFVFFSCTGNSDILW